LEAGNLSACITSGHDEYGEEAKLIGVYRSPEAGAVADPRLLVEPGFRDRRERFQADAYTLNQDHWCEGFGIKG
jgi:hypothetical protein